MQKKNNKSLQDKVNESEKLKISELQTTQKLTVDNQKLKTEFDKVKVEGEEGEKKSVIIQESLKSKLDQLELDHDMTIRKLNEEKLDLKKQQKGAQKTTKVIDESPEGKVSQEAVEKVSKEFSTELEKLKTELETQKKERISSEASKRNLDLQLNTVRDQLEQEERQRKKLEVQKKTTSIRIR